MKRSTSLFVSAIVAILLTTVNVPARKMKADQLVALHLKSIGENLVWKNRVAQGLGTMDIRVGGQGKLGGPAMLLAEADKMRTSFNFGHTQYPQETLIRNGDKVDVAYISPGVRSQLGTALWNNFPRLAQEGLYGGVLSTDWALLDLRKKRAKVRYRGLKKFEGKELHELEYRPKKGVDYRIRLYFEPETFRHVASSYRLSVPGGMGRGLVDIAGDGRTGGGAGAGGATAPGGGGFSGPQYNTRPGPSDGPANQNRINLVETFSDFKQVDGLTLPHLYRITLNVDAQSGFVGHWEIKIDRMSHNRKISAKAFAIK